LDSSFLEATILVISKLKMSSTNQSTVAVKPEMCPLGILTKTEYERRQKAFGFIVFDITMGHSELPFKTEEKKVADLKKGDILIETQALEVMDVAYLYKILRVNKKTLTVIRVDLTGEEVPEAKKKKMELYDWCPTYTVKTD
jgi:hypothetical protein